MIAYHPLFVHPLPENHRFPMVKYELIYEQLLREGVADQRDFFETSPIDEKLILTTHNAKYWKKLKTLSLDRLEARRTGFPLSNQLIEREKHIAMGTVESAVHALQNGLGFNIAGGTHHAGSDWGEGFCLLNDQAIAANYLLDHHELNRILIVDLDVHQGNGTAEIFYADERVFTLSVHGKNNFPFKKEKSSLDVGLQDGISDKEYLRILKYILPEIFEKVQPQFVFYLSGVDVLASDKMGKLKLSLEGCRQRDWLVYELCKQHHLPVQTSMGGGYSKFLREITDAHCNTFKTAFRLLN